jgi:hypothetical protein
MNMCQERASSNFKYYFYIQFNNLKNKISYRSVGITTLTKAFSRVFVNSSVPSICLSDETDEDDDRERELVKDLEKERDFLSEFLLFFFLYPLFNFAASPGCALKLKKST